MTAQKDPGVRPSTHPYKCSQRDDESRVVTPVFPTPRRMKVRLIGSLEKGLWPEFRLRYISHIGDKYIPRPLDPWGERGKGSTSNSIGE